LQEEDARRT
jgi:hypothetical protein